MCGGGTRQDPLRVSEISSMTGVDSIGSLPAGGFRVHGVN